MVRRVQRGFIFQMFIVELRSLSQTSLIEGIVLGECTLMLCFVSDQNPCDNGVLGAYQPSTGLLVQSMFFLASFNLSIPLSLCRSSHFLTQALS